MKAKGHAAPRVGARSARSGAPRRIKRKRRGRRRPQPFRHDEPLPRAWCPHLLLERAHPCPAMGDPVCGPAPRLTHRIAGVRSLQPATWADSLAAPRLRLPGAAARGAAPPNQPAHRTPSRCVERACVCGPGACCCDRAGASFTMLARRPGLRAQAITLVRPPTTFVDVGRRRLWVGGQGNGGPTARAAQQHGHQHAGSVAPYLTSLHFEARAAI